MGKAVGKAWEVEDTSGFSRSVSVVQVQVATMLNFSKQTKERDFGRLSVARSSTVNTLFVCVYLPCPAVSSTGHRSGLPHLYKYLRISSLGAP